MIACLLLCMQSCQFWYQKQHSARQWKEGKDGKNTSIQPCFIDEALNRLKAFHLMTIAWRQLPHLRDCSAWFHICILTLICVLISASCCAALSEPACLSPPPVLGLDWFCKVQADSQHNRALGISLCVLHCPHAVVVACEPTVVYELAYVLPPAEHDVERKEAQSTLPCTVV